MKQIEPTSSQKSLPPINAEISPEDLLNLAGEYRLAALMLEHRKVPGEAGSRAPCRLLAIHSIELYLTTFLLFKGESYNSVRKMGHDLETRFQAAQKHGLVLRKTTMNHLAKITQQREYLAARYAPTTIPEPNQLAHIMESLRQLANAVFKEADAFRLRQPGLERDQ